MNLFSILGNHMSMYAIFIEGATRPVFRC